MSITKTLRQLAAMLKMYSGEHAKSKRAVLNSGLVGQRGLLIAIYNDQTADESVRQDAKLLSGVLGRVVTRKTDGAQAADVISSTLDREPDFDRKRVGDSGVISTGEAKRLLGAGDKSLGVWAKAAGVRKVSHGKWSRSDIDKIKESRERK